MSRARKGGGFALALGMTGWFVWYASNALPDIDPEIVYEPKVWGGVLVAALLYASIIPITAWAWSRLLFAQGDARSPRVLAVLMGRTQLAKYVPGNVAQHAARMALAIRAGIRVPAYLSTVLQETLLAVLASFVVGMAALAVDPRGRAVLSEVGQQAQWGLLGLLALGGMAGVLVLRCFASRWQALSVLRLPSARVSAPPFFAYVANYLLIGVGLAVLARALELPAALGLAATTGAFALSWVLGFLAPGAPAGLGVREGLMVVMLAGTAAPEAVVLFVVLARVATLVGDGVCFLVAWSLEGGLREEG